MKKVLALVLAVMMLATVAFAADDYIDGNTGGANSAGTGNITPGSKLKYGEKDAQKIPGIGVTKAINSTNYSISNIKYEDGKNLVESIKFNDADDLLEIKLKQDYTMTTPKELALTLVLKGKKVAKGNRPDDITLQVGEIKGVGTKLTVGYPLKDKKDYTVADSGIIIVDNEDVRVPNNAGTTKAVYKVVKYDNGSVKGTDVYGTMEMTAVDTDVEIEARVYEDDKLFLYNEIDADDDILKKYADTDADITFLSFPAAPTFNATATVRFYKDEDSFIYGMKDGKLVNVNAKWDDDEGCFILKTRTLGSYVFSDKKLSVAATTPGSENPDTGANDVVGIAAALAAVALVSAAAVSLKK